MLEARSEGNVVKIACDKLIIQDFAKNKSQRSVMALDIAAASVQENKTRSKSTIKKNKVSSSRPKTQSGDKSKKITSYITKLDSTDSSRKNNPAVPNHLTAWEVRKFINSKDDTNRNQN